MSGVLSYFGGLFFAFVVINGLGSVGCDGGVGGFVPGGPVVVVRGPMAVRRGGPIT